MLLGDRSVPYDYLILSPGSSHSYFGKDEWATLAPGLKWVDDALEIRRRILLAYEQAEREGTAGAPGIADVRGGGSRACRGGAGRGNGRDRPPDAQARLPHHRPGAVPDRPPRSWPPGAPHLPEELSASAVERPQRLGVEVRTGAMVTAITPTEVRIGQDGEAIETRTALWAPGCRPRRSCAPWASRWTATGG